MSGPLLRTNHVRILMLIAQHNRMSLIEIADAAELAERTVQRIVEDLEEAGYVSRKRVGRRNRYTVHRDAPLHDGFGGAVGELLDGRSDTGRLGRA
jgi:DNA-binding Lrp family transcriptional regulator